MLNTKSLIFFLGIVQFVFSGNLLSQEILHKRYLTDNGLPSNTIYDIHQDKRGFIWFATDNGLTRFDGREFKIYPFNKGSSNAASNIMEAGDGTIWCQTFAGEFFYTRNDSCIQESKIDDSNNYMPAVILEDTILVYFSREGYSLLNTITHTLKKKKLKNQADISSEALYKNKFVGVSGIAKELIIVDVKGRYETMPYTLTFETINFMPLNDTLYFINRTQPVKMGLLNGKTISLNDLFEKRFLRNFQKLDNSNACILTSKGCFFYNPSDENRGKKAISNCYFKDENLSNVIRDREGNYWFSTLGQGVIFVPFLNAVFDSGTKNVSYIFKKDEQNLLVGTKDNELYEYNHVSRSRKLLFKDSLNHEIRSIYYNHYTKEILFSNQFLYVLKKDKVESINISISDIDEADSVTYLISESGNLGIYPVTNESRWKAWEQVGRRIMNQRLPLFTERMRTRSACFLNDTVYAATTNGFFKVYKSGKKEVLFNGESILAKSILKMNDTLFIVTKSKGIFRYYNQQLNVILDAKNGLKSDVYTAKIYGNTIYIITMNGSIAINSRGQRIYDSYFSDGQVNLDVYDFTVVKDSFLYSDKKGIIKFPINKSYLPNYKPIIALNEIYVNQKEVPLDTKLYLDHAENFIELAFSIIDFKGQRYTQAFYQINEGNWMPTGNSNKLLFTTLPPGNYTVKFKAVSQRGVISEITALQIVISPPFYRTWWFIILVIITVVALIYIGIKMRIKGIEAKNKLLTDKINLEKALHKSTLSSIKAQMNPHFLFNALNTIQSYIYLNDKKNASAYLVSFSELTRQILEMSNKEKVSLSEEYRALELYLSLEKMRFEEEFNYVINKLSPEYDNLLIPSMLIQPYVENAVKHGLLHKKGKKLLTLSFRLSDALLVVEIEDNGIGMEASKELNKQKSRSHQSFATSANQKRFELLNEGNDNKIGVETINLTNNFQQCIGTKIVLTIPIS